MSNLPLRKNKNDEILVCSECGSNQLQAKGTTAKGEKRYRCTKCGSQARVLTQDRFTKKHNGDILFIEEKFKSVAGIEADLTVYPMSEDTENTQVTTDKDKSNEFGEVFTPLWLVDKMLEKANMDWADEDHTTLDMCSGYGQFTIRMIRKKFNLLGDKFDLKKFLEETHNFNEIQIDSCFKLLDTFGTDINLFIGDSRKLNELNDNDKKIVYYFEEYGWHNITVEVKELYKKNTLLTIDLFVSEFEAMIEAKKEALSSLEDKAEKERNRRAEEKRKEEEDRKRKEAKEVEKQQDHINSILEY